MTQDTQKPSHGEWMEWAQVVLDRLTASVHIYSKPPHNDVQMLEAERQKKNGVALSLLRRIHDVIADNDTPTESLAEVYLHDERAIDGLAILMRETLDLLPSVSVDMQKLLKSEWYDKCNGRVASELFRGPMGDLQRGIGSGYAEQGRLPEVLDQLLERERIGDRRHPRKELHRLPTAEVLASDEETGPKRHTREQKRRYSDGSGAV